MSMNNPAGRLHALLKAASKVPTNEDTVKAWHRVLGRPDTPLLEFLPYLAPVFEMPNQVMTAVLGLEDIDNDERVLILDWLPNVEQAFLAHHLAGPFNGFKDQLKPEVLRSLAHCNSVLKKASPEPVLEKEQLTSMLTDTRNLHEQVTESALDAELKLFLLTHLREIERAIENYQILGAPGISRAANDAIGTVFAKEQQSGVFTRLQQSELGQKALVLIRRIAFVAQLGSNLARIGDGGASAVQWYLEAGEVPEAPPLPDAPHAVMNPPKSPKS